MYNEVSNDEVRISSQPRLSLLHDGFVNGGQSRPEVRTFQRTDLHLSTGLSSSAGVTQHTCFPGLRGVLSESD